MYSYTTTGGAHGDYKSGPFNVTILPGNSSGSYNVSITDDNIFETNETFNLTINASSLPSRVLLQPNCMIICTIIDNDDGKFHFIISASRCDWACKNQPCEHKNH